MKMKWIYFIIVGLILLSGMLVADIFPLYKVHNLVWSLIIISGVGTVILYLGWFLPRTKLGRHFNKKLTIKIKYIKYD